jgi:hypothetical protein
MNINIAKIEKVVIRDNEGRVVHTCKLGMISIVTNRDKTQELVIQAAKS